MSYLAPSLKRLLAEVNGRWPGRDHASDGWLGDPAHAARISDHNPDWKGCVHALDIDATLSRRMGAGSVGDAVFAALLVGCRSGRLRNVVNYMIYRGRIYTRASGYAGHEYDGDNKHFSHIHISIFRNAVAEFWPGNWGVRSRITSGSRIPPRLWPAISLGAVEHRDRPSWQRIQKRLNRKLGTRLVVDGIPGAATRNTYARWQRRLGYSGADANGWPGKASLIKLGFRVKP